MPEINTPSVPVTDLTDESFDIGRSNTYHLSILAGEESFSYSILDTSTNKYLALRSGIPFPVSGVELLKNNFRSVTCAVAHTRSTLVPNALFDEESKKELLGFNHPVKEDEKIHSDALRNLKARNLFTISRKFETAIRDQFPQVHILHGFTSFLEGLLVQNKNNSGIKVFADFSSDFFEVAILDGRNLVFSNAFGFKTPEDIAYYILFVFEQLHLNPDTIELVLSGEIEKIAEGHSLLYTYIRNVRFAALPGGFSYSYKFDDVPSHKFFTLFNQYLCA